MIAKDLMLILIVVHKQEFVEVQQYQLQDGIQLQLQALVVQLQYILMGLQNH